MKNNKSKIILTAIFCLVITLGSKVQGMDDNPFFSEIDSPTESKVFNMKIIKKNNYWYTESFRPANKVNPSKIALDTSTSKPMHGGAIIWFDDRNSVEDTSLLPWQVHGQLTMDFNGVPYIGSGTLVSPSHVLTAGHNLYDPDNKLWAKNVKFYPGRNGQFILGDSNPALCLKKGIFAKWGQGDERSDMGIIELDREVGSQVGWNGLLAGDDDFIRALPPITVSGYPGDKGDGTMWRATSSISEIKEKQFTYALSTFSGQSGSNPWVEFNKNFYSLGVHAYGQENVINTATRLTWSKLDQIVKVINEGIK